MHTTKHNPERLPQPEPEELKSECTRILTEKLDHVDKLHKMGNPA